MNEPRETSSAARTETSGTCPVCGAYTGPATRCSVCGAELRLRTDIRVYRWAALILGTIGLGLLFVMAQYREIPRVRAGDLSRTMNFAYVRLEGEVPDEPRIYRTGDRIESVRFTVRDDTGEVIARATRDRAQQLMERDLIPAAGDRVEVAGSLNIGADGTAALWIQSADQVRRIRAELPITPLGEISDGDEGRVIRIAGEIVSVRPPRSGSRAPWVLQVRDTTGSGSLVLFQNVQEALTARTVLMAGARFEARVAVERYRDALQLQLRRAEDLTWLRGPDAGPTATAPLAPVSPASSDADRAAEHSAKGTASLPSHETSTSDPHSAADSAPLVQIRDITPAMEGNTVRVRGSLRAVMPPPQNSRVPWKWKLTDGDAEIEVAYWSAVARALEGDQAPAPGRAVEITAKIHMWKGLPELRIERAGQIRWLSAAPAEAGGERAP